MKYGNLDRLKGELAQTFQDTGPPAEKSLLHAIPLSCPALYIYTYVQMRTHTRAQCWH